MTAHQFIDQLFSRPGYGMPSNVRRITEAQFALLRELIGQDEEGGAVDRGLNGSMTWMPSGRWKYVLAEDAGRGYRLTKLGNLRPSEAGTLF